jgi:hypothetical protein
MDEFTCPKCWAPLVLVSTAYGWRTICTDCLLKWTYITGEDEPVQEKYTPMTDNVRPLR